VLGTNPASCGGEAVRVRGLSELVRDREAIFLTVLDEIQVLSPEETDLVVFNQTQQISAHRN